jgi:tagatose 6-phosphate kinase
MGRSVSAAAGRPCALFVAASPSIDRQVEVDHLVVGGINRPDRVVAVAGGKGLNAARAAKALGGCVSVATIIGGQSGEWLAERLAATGIYASLTRVAAETRTCVSILERSTGALTEIYEPTGPPPIDPDDWSDLEAGIVRLLLAGTVGTVAISGSLPRGAPVDGYARIVRLAHEAGARAMVDSYGQPFREAVAERPDVVKVNVEEASEATGIAITDPPAAADAASRLLQLGALAAVVTLGGAGAVLASVDGRCHLAVAERVGPYTVGSGDAFLGGMATAIVAGSSLPDAAARGIAAAAANTLQPGAGWLDAAEVTRLLARVEVAAI